MVRKVFSLRALLRKASCIFWASFSIVLVSLFTGGLAWRGGSARIDRLYTNSVLPAGNLVVVVGSGMCRFGSPVCELFHSRACQLLGRRAGTLQCELLRGGELVLEFEAGRTRKTGDTGNAVLVHQ